MYKFTYRNYLLSLIALVFGFAQAQVVPPAEININTTDKLSKSISISFSKFEMVKESIDGINCFDISLPGLQQLCREGYPAVPVFHKFVEVPEGYEIQINNTDFTTKTYEGVRPLPCQKVPDRNQQIHKTKGSLTFNPEVYNGKDIYPSSVIEIGGYQYIAGKRVADLLIYPFRYNPAENSLIVHFNINVDISLSKSKSVKNFEVKYSGKVQQIADEIIISFSDPSRQYTEPKSPSMLIIVHDEFYDNILPFAEWKNRKGIDTRVVKVSELGDRGTDDHLKENIVGYVKNTDGHPAFDYLLLVGDVAYIPPFYGVNEALNDHNYSTLNDGDFLPDIMVGRFSVNSPEECDIYVNKIINYEKSIYQADSFNWLKNATVAASSDKLDDRHGKHIVSVFKNSGFSLIDDLRHSIQKFTNYNIINALNSGRSWLFYIGHGDEVSWMTTGTFSNYTIKNNLTYTGTLPMIVSVACLNNDLDYQYGNSFGENWMTTGVDKGAIGFIGATELTPFYYSDTLGKQALIAYLNGNVQTIGEALVYGKLKMYEAFTNDSPTGQTLETMQHFLLLGDPTLMPYTDKPAKITANAPSQLIQGINNISFTVKANGLPVKNALVSLTSADFSVKHSAYTDETGNVSFTVDLKDTGQLSLVITGRNLMYYEKTIQVSNYSSLGHSSASGEITVYPNPAREHVTVSAGSESINKIEILDIQGKRVYSSNFNDVQNCIVPVTELPSGLYITEITLSNGSVLQEKLTVLHR